MSDKIIELGLNVAFQLVQILGTTVLIGIALSFLARKTQQHLLMSKLRFIYLATAAIGTPVHELGHALMCIVFNHKITAIKLFDPKAPNGILGYVENMSNKLSVYQQVGNFFIAIGPLFSGTVAMLASLYFLLPNVYAQTLTVIKAGLTNKDFHTVLGVFIESAKASISNFSVDQLPQLVIFLVLALSISSHMALSPADLKGAVSGLLVIAVLLAVANLGLVGSSNFIAKGLSYLALGNYLISVFLCFSLILSAISCLVSGLFSKTY